MDITMNNRVETKNATDCGGRLGPVMPDGGPDLRNLVVCTKNLLFWSMRLCSLII